VLSLGGNVVNVRAGPDTGARRLGERREGDVVVAVGRLGPWLRLDDSECGGGGGGEAWVLSYHRAFRAELLRPLLYKDAAAARGGGGGGGGEVLALGSPVTDRSRWPASSEGGSAGVPRGRGWRRPAEPPVVAAERAARERAEREREAARLRNAERRAACEQVSPRPVRAPS
jgi:hypothetical protein